MRSWGIDNASRSKSESILSAIEVLGVSAQRIVYVGDTSNDARAAQSAGVRFVGADWGGFEDMGDVALQAQGKEEVKRRIEAPSIYDAEEGEPPASASPCASPSNGDRNESQDASELSAPLPPVLRRGDRKWGQPWGPPVPVQPFEAVSSPAAAFGAIERALQDVAEL